MKNFEFNWYENGNYVYNYTLKDHLGNTRVVVTDNSGPDVVQETDYYPFGMQFDNSYAGTEFDYKYNGKEYQDEIDLNLYDYGARFYDPATKRFLSKDPPPARTMPLSTISAASSGGASSRTSLITSQINFIGSSRASLISSEETEIVFGIPIT